MKLPKILIVNPKSGFTRIVKLLLTHKGYEVKEINDPRLALETAREFVPDLILLDIVMPWIDEGDVALQFRSDSELKGVPIVLTSEVVSKRDNAQPKLLGDYPVLWYPIFKDDLIRCIEQYLPRDTTGDSK